MKAKVDFFVSLHNHKKDDNQSKNKTQPELPENWTVWKSKNQGFKEETFFQTGRRVGEDTVCCGEAAATVASGTGGHTLTGSG